MSECKMKQCNQILKKMYFKRKTISNVQKKHLDKNLNILNAKYI